MMPRHVGKKYDRRGVTARCDRVLCTCRCIGPREEGNTNTRTFLFSASAPSARVSAASIFWPRRAKRCRLVVSALLAWRIRVECGGPSLVCRAGSQHAASTSHSDHKYNYTVVERSISQVLTSLILSCGKRQHLFINGNVGCGGNGPSEQHSDMLSCHSALAGVFHLLWGVSCLSH